jgi:hypothetical protein
MEFRDFSRSEAASVKGANATESLALISSKSEARWRSIESAAVMNHGNCPGTSWSDPTPARVIVSSIF